MHVSVHDAEVARVGAMYLRIVGPVYVCFGLGLGLFFVCQTPKEGFSQAPTPAMADQMSRRLKDLSTLSNWRFPPVHGADRTDL
jgi:hypothetical protein